MFDRDDNIYSGGSGLFSGAFQLGLAGVGVYGGIKLINNSDKMKEAALKFYNKVAPITEPTLNSYDQSVKNIRSSISSVSNSRIIRSELSSELKNMSTLQENQAANGSVQLLPNISGLPFNDLQIPDHTKPGWGISKWSDVKDFAGNDVGTKALKNLTEMNREYGLGLNLDAVTWNGTTAIIPTSSGAELKIGFSKATDTGEHLIKNGNATYSATTYYERVVGASGELTGEINIIDQNSKIAELLGNHSMVRALAANSVPDSAIMSYISDSGLGNLEKILNNRQVAKEASEALSRQGDVQRLKAALKIYGIDTERYVAPLDTIGRIRNAGLIVPDPFQKMQLASTPGYENFNSEFLEANAIRPTIGASSRDTAEKIRRSYDIYGTNPDKVRYKGLTLTEAINSAKDKSYLQDMFVDLFQGGGINQNVSSGQIPYRTANIGGLYTGPSIAEGYKALSINSFSTFGNNKPGKYAWKFKSRYTTQTQGRTGRLVEAVNNNKSLYTMYGAIDFLGEERFEINKKLMRNMYHESPITVSFDGYSELQGQQKISLKRIGKSGKKSLKKYTLNDLYDNSTETGKELESLMLSGDWEIILPKGLEIGNRDLARPISGYMDELGTEVFNRSVKLKQTSLIGKTEYAAFAGINAGKKSGSLIQLPLRMRTLTTKIGGHGGLWRASNTYRDFNGSYLDFIAGVDLFKNIIPTLNESGSLAVAKQTNEILPFMHSLMLGLVQTLDKEERTVKLTGNRAKEFNSFLGMDSLNPTGEIDLNHLMKSGNLSFQIGHNDQKAYAKQLGFMTNLTSDIRSSWLENDENITLGDNRVSSNDFLTNAWNDTLDFYKNQYDDYRMTKTPIPKQYQWTMSTQVTALEGAELSQGAKGFNTVKFSMRDQYMYIASGRENVLNELLSRNDIDSIQLIKERELLRRSIMDPHNMSQAVKEYADYIRDIYGDKEADRYLKQIELHKAGDITGMKKDLKTLGTEANIDDVREIKEYIAKSFIASDTNLTGKILIGEDGRLIHLPSSQAMRGLTILPDGKITFEGKEGTNVKAFWNIAHEATVNGTVPRFVVQQSNDAYHRLYNIIGKNSANIQIHSGSYARNVYDDKLTNSKIMDYIESGAIGDVTIDAETRARIGSIASISKREATLMVQDEILKAVFNSRMTGRTVVQSMNDIHSDWIIKDHKDILTNVQKIIDKAGELIDYNDIGKIAGTAADNIIKVRSKYSEQLTNKLFKLEHARLNNNTNEINTLLKEIEEHVRTKSFPIWLERNPIIFQGSESGAYGFINTNKSSLPKQISVGFMHKVNTAGDTDGDKFEYLLMHSKEAREDIDNSIVGIQSLTEGYMREAKNRIKLMAGKSGRQAFNFTKKERLGLAKYIFETQGEASVYAHYMTKAYTGAMNTQAFLTKAGLERTAKLAAAGQISRESLEEVLAWTRSIPSFLTEQQVISSKQLTAIIGKGLKSKTPIQKIISNIGKMSPEDMLATIKETGSVHPLLQKSLAAINNNPARKMQYEQVTKVVDVVNNLATGFNRYTAEQLIKYSDYLKGGRTDEEYSQYMFEMLEKQRKFMPLVERESFRKVLGIDKRTELTQILSRADLEHKGNIEIVLKNVQEKLAKSGLSFSTAEQEHVMELINAHINKVWNASDELYGSELMSKLPKASRQIRGWNKIAPKINAVSNWIKEAPLQRLGGIGIAAMGAMAIVNILAGSSIESERDVPSMNSPGMEGYGNSSTSAGYVHGNNFRNTSYYLLSKGTTPHMDSISSINNMVGNNGYHSVSVRNDSTNPYLDKMSYYN